MYTVIDDTINEIPIIKTYCTSKTTGYNNKYQVSPTPENKQKAIIITVDIIKLIAPLVATETGNISLGKYTFCIMFPVCNYCKCCLLHCTCKVCPRY